MSSSSNDLVKEAGVYDDEYCKLSYFLYSAVKSCGIDILQDNLYDYSNDNMFPETQDLILQIATGKQFGLKNLSYKTVLLEEKNESTSTKKFLTEEAQQHQKHIPFPDALQQRLELDPFLLGGMMPIQPSHVLICSPDWVRTFYMEPIAKLQQQTHTVQVDVSDVQSLFVRSTAEEIDAEAMDMVAKFQKLMAEKGGSNRMNDEPKFQSFSGQGQTLGGGGGGGGGTTGTGTTTGTDSGTFDPSSLKDVATPPSVDKSAPTTNIAVRLPTSGKRAVLQLNLTHTVQDFATLLVQQQAPTQKFRLVAGFPPKPLDNPSATIEEAGLKGAQVKMEFI